MSKLKSCPVLFFTLAPPSAPRYILKPDDFARLEGVYRSMLDGRFVTLVRDTDALRIERGAALIAQSGTRFVTTGGQTWEFDERGHARAQDRYDIVEYERVSAVKPTVEELKVLAGTYVSDEAETTLLVAMEGGTLVLNRRPDVKVPLTPVYKDAFNAPPLGVVLFRRDASGQASALSVVQDRVWDLRFSLQRPGNIGASR